MRRQCLLFLYRAAALGALAAALALYLVEARLGLGLLVASEKRALRGAESRRESGARWMGGGTKRRCDRTLGAPRLPRPAGRPLHARRRAVRKYLIICALSYNSPYKPPYK